MPAGAIVAILGVNGAGKTTLLKTIAGLLKPKSGKIHFLREDITALKPHQVVKKGIALVPEGRAILAKMTVLENLEMGAYHRKDHEVRRRYRKGNGALPLASRKAEPSRRFPFRGRTADAGHLPGLVGQTQTAPPG